MNIHDNFLPIPNGLCFDNGRRNHLRFDRLIWLIHPAERRTRSPYGSLSRALRAYHWQRVCKMAWQNTDFQPSIFLPDGYLLLVFHREWWPFRQLPALYYGGLVKFLMDKILLQPPLFELQGLE